MANTDDTDDTIADLVERAEIIRRRSDELIRQMQALAAGIAEAKAKAVRRDHQNAKPAAEAWH